MQDVGKWLLCLLLLDLNEFSCVFFAFRRCEIQKIHLATQDDNRLLLGHCQLHWRVFCYNVLGNDGLILFCVAYMAYFWKYQMNYLQETYIFNTFMPQMEKSDAYRKGSGASKKWDGGGPGGPGGGPYGGGPRGPPRGLDNVRGIDHSKFTLLLHMFDYSN